MANKVSSSVWVLKLGGRSPRLEVKPGQKVFKGDFLAEIRETKKNWFDLAGALQIKPSRLMKLIEPPVSSSLKEGDLIAERKSILGKKRQFLSPISGVFAEFDSQRGRIRIDLVENKKITSPVTGKIILANKDKIKIGFKARVFEGKGQGAGGKIWGELIAFSTYFGINSTVEEKIIVLNKADRKMLSRARALGARAAIVKKKAGKSVPLPFFLPDDYAALADACEGKTVLLDFPNGRILACE